MADRVVRWGVSKDERTRRDIVGPPSDTPNDVDVRFGHDLSRVQDANGVDLLLLEHHLRLTVEQRLESLEQRVSQVAELRAGLRRC